jgi:UDP-glucose 4-epimerase
LIKWLKQWPDLYTCDAIDMHGDAWMDCSFAGYQTVFHVAGIAHQPKASAELMHQVNCSLAFATASKAKQDGVRQFILMSTMAVYGASDVMGRKNEIDKESVPDPKTPYGKSKWAAEQLIRELQDTGGDDHPDDVNTVARIVKHPSNAFEVCIVRPPMIYGNGCPGNYRTLRSIALRFGIAPDITNERSMIYIDNLSEFVRVSIDSELSGVYCPHDVEPVCTAEMMGRIASNHGRRLRRSKFLGAIVKVMAELVPQLRKAFGNLTCSRELSVVPHEEYCVFGAEEAIKKTEFGWE